MGKNRRLSGRKDDACRPPGDQPWTWQSREMIQSPAWRGRSINLVRLIDALLDENMGHAGTENGNLIQTYNQLEAAGVTRRLLSRTIEEGEARGLLRVRHGGPKGHVEVHVSRYRLTWVGSCRPAESAVFRIYEPPTDEWKIVTEEQVQERLAQWDLKQSKAAEWRRKNRKQVSDSAPVRVSESTPQQVSDSAPPNRQAIDSAEKRQVSDSAPLSISRAGARESDAQPTAPIKQHSLVRPAPARRGRVEPLRTWNDVEKARECSRLAASGIDRTRKKKRDAGSNASDP